MWSKGRESMPCGILELKFVLWHSIGTPMVGRLECLRDPWSYAGGSFIYWWSHISDIASQAEDAASRREQGRIYKITKLVYGRYRGGSDTPIMNKKGRLLMTEAEQDARWMEHFSEVLNRPPPPQIQICKR